MWKGPDGSRFEVRENDLIWRCCEIGVAPICSAIYLTPGFARASENCLRDLRRDRNQPGRGLCVPRWSSRLPYRLYASGEDMDRTLCLA
jgi:hypothetical protein